MVFFIDGNTYYNTKMVMQMNVNGQQMEMTSVNSDFRKTNSGFVMPYSIKVDFPGITLTTTSNKIEINKEIDQAIFEMPKN
jgi:hypothetical protein